MLRPLTAICIFISVFLVGCSTGVTTPTITTSPAMQISLPAVVKTEPALTPTVTAAAIRPASPAIQTPLPAIVKTEPALIPTVTATAIRSVSPVLSNADQVLKSAVANLLNAVSFEMAAHEVRAYQTIGANGATSLVYGEFNTNYTVIRLPSLKVYGNHEYRFDPQGDFLRYDSYSYQENSQYFTRLVENSVTGAAEEIDIQWIEPIGGDLYQTLVTCSDQAKFVTESDGVAVYILEHPKWYKLKGAIGFADLGFLHMQENGEQLVEQYVAEHYPNVETILFTIYVAVDERVITRAEVNDRDFMISLFAKVGRALVEQGVKVETLARYEIMDVNGSEYLFSNYNQVQDFEIP